jgi:hypothetical protein
MFDELKRKIAHYIIRHKFLKKSNEQIHFSKVISNSKTVFIILPADQKDLYYSLNIVDYLVMKDKQITFFVPFENRNAITKYDNATILTYHSTSITKIFMPNKTLIQKLNSMEFDLVIDLERNENTFISAVANIIKSKVRIGFKKNRSENYYNLLIQNSDQNIESNYMNLLTSIKML